MEKLIELLSKITATRNAQKIHMRNATMLNNFTKILYEISFDEYLQQITKEVELCGHKIPFPETWVKPKIQDILRRYKECELDTSPKKWADGTIIHKTIKDFEDEL